MYNFPTDKQFSFIRKLVAERQLDAELDQRVASARLHAMNGEMTKADASALIDELLDAPSKPQADERADEPEAGIYRSERRLFRVYLGQQSQRMLVKEIRIDVEGLLDVEQDVAYDYLGAAARHLPSDARRLELDEVGKLGIAFGECLCCGRRLDDPESVDRGIGPVCAANY